MIGPIFFTFSLFISLVLSLSSLNASAMQGRWYQVYTSLAAKETFQAKSFCNTVDYYNLTKTDSSVYFNATHTKSLESPQGTIHRTNLTMSTEGQKPYPGKFSCLYTDALLKVETYLRVKAFGAPEGNSTLYPWMFLSSSNRLYVQILARDPQSFQFKFNDIVLKTVDAMGYTGELFKPIPIYHSDFCNYAPTR